MRTRRILPLFLLATSAALMGAGFLIQGRTLWAAFLIPVTLIGGLSIFQDRAWASTLTFIFLTVLAGGGLWTGTLPVFFILGQITSLAAWDLQHFHHTVSQLDDPRGWADQRRRHYLYLGLTLGAGAGLSLLAFNIQLSVDFFPALVLSILLVISLKQLIQHGSGSSDNG